MKLLLCLECSDMFNLDLKMKKCSCGKTKEQYIDNSNASLKEAIVNKPDEGLGKKFTAFTIQKTALSLSKEGKYRYFLFALFYPFFFPM